MSNFKLYYFNARGGAEIHRFIFAQAGVKYEDIRVEWGSKEWEELKPKSPTGKLPMLEVDGAQLTGSGPMARFLAEKFGVAGNNDLENAQIAGIYDNIVDFRTKVVPVLFMQDQEEKAKKVKELEEETIPSYFSTLERFIEKNKGNTDAGWIFGSNPTYCDFAICLSLDFVLRLCPDCLKNYPGIAKVKSAVENLPKIAKWIKERPKTEY